MGLSDFKSVKSFEAVVLLHKMRLVAGASRALLRTSFARPASSLSANSGLESEAEGTVNKLLARWDEYKESNSTHVAPMSSMHSHADVLLSEKPKVVLLEGIHEAAVAMFEARGMEVTSYSKALEGDELLAVAADCHLLGIRSKTQLSADFFDRIGKERHRLWTVGCFCIGTNQVDCSAAAQRGVGVFNAPFSNTRSVAEKTLGEIIALSRRSFERSTDMHNGLWSKSAKRSHEVRGRTLGIVGYGRIGSQISVLAEGLGMKVIFYDTRKTLSLGNADVAASLDDLLARSDVVSLHVPSTPQTDMMINAEKLALMKPNSLLINNARGSVVDLEALASMIKFGHIGGAAVDVFPDEPAKNGEFEVGPLRNLKNVILTPHVGGSTEEAQVKIAEEVASKMIHGIENGSSTMSINLPELELPEPRKDVHRILHLHHNVPGVLMELNRAVAALGMNVVSQFLHTQGDQGYVVLDVAREDGRELLLKSLLTHAVSFIYPVTFHANPPAHKLTCSPSYILI